MGRVLFLIGALAFCSCASLFCPKVSAEVKKPEMALEDVSKLPEKPSNTINTKLEAQTATIAPATTTTTKQPEEKVVEASSIQHNEQQFYEPQFHEPVVHYYPHHEDPRFVVANDYPTPLSNVLFRQEPIMQMGRPVSHAPAWPLFNPYRMMSPVSPFHMGGYQPVADDFFGGPPPQIPPEILAAGGPIIQKRCETIIYNAPMDSAAVSEEPQQAEALVAPPNPHHAHPHARQHQPHPRPHPHPHPHQFKHEQGENGTVTADSSDNQNATIADGGAAVDDDMMDEVPVHPIRRRVKQWGGGWGDGGCWDYCGWPCPEDAVQPILVNNIEEILPCIEEYVQAVQPPIINLHQQIQPITEVVQPVQPVLDIYDTPEACVEVEETCPVYVDQPVCETCESCYVDCCDDGCGGCGW